MTVTNSASGTNVHEISAGIFRISTPIPPSQMPGGFTFNQFLVVDRDPLLFHTGPRRMFPLVREAVTHVLGDAAKLRYVGFSHVEADECGSINEWLEIAPRADVVCSQVAVMVQMNDLANRPPRGQSSLAFYTTGPVGAAAIARRAFAVEVPDPIVLDKTLAVPA